MLNEISNPNNKGIMGTRSYIAYEMKNGMYTGCYCHWDGYPQGVGLTLLKNYNDENIRDLVDLQGFSSLGETVAETKSTAYHEIKEICETRGELYSRSTEHYGCEYIYVLLKNGDWVFWDVDEEMEKNLKEVLDISR